MTTHLILGPNGSGKTRRLQQLIAQAAADPATTTWVIDPRGELTAADRHTTSDGAEQLLADLLAEVDKRHARPSDHQPTQAEPRIRLLVDEAEQLLRRAPLAEQLYRLTVTGRSAGVDTVLAAATTRLDVWPLALRAHYSPETTETLPPRR